MRLPFRGRLQRLGASVALPGRYRVGWGIGALLLGICTASGAGQSIPASAPVSDEQAAFFEKNVRPVLVTHCYSCHSDALQMGGLRLDSRAAIVKGGVSGTALSESDPAKSLLLTAVHYDGKLKMPPAGKLSASQIEALTAWVRMGAPWPTQTPQTAPASKSTTFWSFQPVKVQTPPAVKNRAWCRSPLDAFILADLEKKALTPAPPASKTALLRRVTFDLTGLPPTPAEVKAFLADTSPNAYEKVVDRLLASPRYGERWGRHWLDVVRYADSQDARGIGSEGDISEAWRYRDWVVDAFNQDLPYNQFIVQQIAGDLLPPPPGQDTNASGITATGLLAIGDWGNGDADKEKLLTDIVDDQVDVVSRGFLGLTVACARCHDHKFDPIPTRDYYGLAGIFFSSHILPKFTPKGQGELPMRIPLGGKQEQARREKWQQQTTQVDQQLKAARDTSRAALAKELLPQTARYVSAAWEFTSRPAVQQNVSLADWASARHLHPFALRQWMGYLGLGEYRLLTNPARDILGASGVYALRDGAASDTPTLLANTNAEPRTLLTFTLPPHGLTLHPAPQTGVGVGWHSPISGNVQIIGRVVDADPGGGDGIAWMLDQRSGAERKVLASGDFGNGGAQDFYAGTGGEALRQTVAVRAGDVLQLLILPKQSHAFDTTVVEWTLRDIRTGKVWKLSQEVTTALARAKTAIANPCPDRYGNRDVWRFYDLAGSRRAVEEAGTPEAVIAWDRAVRTLQSTAEVASASEVFAGTFAATDARSPFWINDRNDETALPTATRTVIADLTRQGEMLRKDTPPPPGFAHGVQDGGLPETAYAGIHDARIHIRGNYTRLGESVPRHVPTVLLTGNRQPMMPAQQSGRLELARWIASDKHPLTARVMVNRIWQHHFGAGLVRTPSNFGALGERPTNPALLDWLATQFVKNRWSLKKMHRLIVLSATYRQSSDAPAKTLKTDPDNRLWGRMNRHRLEAEAIRDNLLAVSGELTGTRGGVAVRDVAQPRRSLYITTIRSERTGFGPLFDAPNASASVDTRTVSIVAPQALFLLNNTFVLDRARALSRRIGQETPRASESARIAHTYQLVYGRAPSKAENQIGASFLAQAARTKPDSGLTPWEQYCQILLCGNEFVYVD